MFIQELSDLIKTFQTYNRLRNLPPRTITLYQDVLDSYITFCKNGNGDIGNITTISLRDYFGFLKSKGTYSPHTISIHYRSLRSFLNFLVQEGNLQLNPITPIKSPRVPKKAMPTLTDGEIKKLLHTTNRRTFPGLRDYTIILLLLDTGIRISEALSVELNDVNLGEGVILINGKGDKQRIVPFGLRVRKSLKKYLLRRLVLSDYGKLFTTRDGLPLETHRIQVQMSRLGRRAGITGKRVSPHKLRHTFAKKYIMNGGDSFSLQHLLGHATVEMVKNYVNMFSADVQTQHRKFSPVDRM